ncbi:MAG: efflux RND transporter periplasmic adaptor subunit [Bacteroidaceae bacterium]|nr:efflux RND transporter periplasmic adaptor subunit [Bacteroidaceae bacterium]
MKSRLILVAASCIALLSSCGGGGNAQMGGGNAPKITVMTVNTTTSHLTNSYPAIIRGKQDVDIRPMVSGFITRLHVDEGSVVKRGQVLFTIDQTQYQAAVNQAKAAVESAKATVATQQLTVDNRRRLNEKNITSDYDLQMQENQLASAKAALAQAEAGLTNAMKNLQYTTVTSPTDGIVGQIPYRLGSLVSPSSAQPLTTVSDLSNMYAYFSMTERELLQMTENHGADDILKGFPQVHLQLIDGSMYDQPGRVETISGDIDLTTGSVNLRALFPNPNKVLRRGSTVNVVFPNDLENIILVPQSATFEVQDKHFVYVLQPDNTVKTTEITVHPVTDGKNFVVVGGLNAGDKIATEGVQSLRDGATIQPITSAEKEEIYQQNLKDQREGNMQSAMQ